ncbi:MAG TPA: VOC family protein [Cyclobacteriaceae bacterium]|nr:VOC family protein [Cyclobacteriaceae bacterium]
MSQQDNSTFFAPHLTIKVVRPAMEFYQKAFDAKVLRTFENPDGSVHVVEMEIQGCMFHIHEEVKRDGQMSPDTLKLTTVLIGFFVPDPDKLHQQAASVGGQITSAMQDYDYGYRQGVITDPFGHQWLLQKRI